MSDRFDPKSSARPSDGRGGLGGTADDPLAELARIVSGRSPFDTAPPAKPDRQPAPVQNTPPQSNSHAAPSHVSQPQPNPFQIPLPSEAELARDLEAELLNELQASFSTIPEIVGRPVAIPQAAPPPPAAVVPQFPVFQPPAQPLAPQQPKAPPQTVPQPLDVLEELGIPADMLFRPPQAPDSDIPRAPQMVPMPPSPQPRAEAPARQQLPVPQKRESLATRIARAAQGGDRNGGASARSEPPRVPAPPARQPRASQQPNGRSDPAMGQFRPTLTPNPPQADAVEAQRASSTRWDPPGEQRQALPDLSRFAPIRSDAPAPEQGQRRQPQSAPADEAFDQDFVEEFPFAAADEPDFGQPPASQAADTIPGYGDDDEVPYPEDDFASYERRRSPFQSPFLIAAVLGIVAIGGAAAIVFRPDSAPETPPIIAADTAPTKVAPADTASGEGESQAKLIYDRVDPGSEVAGSQLVVPDEDPIADIPPIPGESAGDSPVSRVILEGGPGFDPPEDATDPNAPMDLTGPGASAARSAPEADAIGPKKVRTVVVRPDGTIVSSAASEGESAPALPDIPPASETPPAPAADQNPLLAEDFGSDAVAAAPPPAAAAPPPSVQLPSASASIPDIPAPPPVPTVAPPRVQAPPPPTVVATTGTSGGPLDMTPASSGSQAAMGGSGGGFLVQVSSQRSEDTAMTTFRDLQRRYPRILGDRAPDIQRADLGERGVYFRVRVGYPTRDAAIGMCENLKAAGGDCILATR